MSSLANSALLNHRKKCMSAYRNTASGRCEVSDFLRGDPAFVKWESHHCLPSIEVHHIYGRGSEKHEHFSNYILVSNAAHDWGHDSCPREFECACLFAKLEKREKRVLAASKAGVVNPEKLEKALLQFDPLVLADVCKRASFRGRVELLRDAVGGKRYVDMCDKVLLFLDDNEYGDV